MRIYPRERPTVRFTEASRSIKRLTRRCRVQIYPSHVDLNKPIKQRAEDESGKPLPACRGVRRHVRQVPTEAARITRSWQVMFDPPAPGRG